MAIAALLEGTSPTTLAVSAFCLSIFALSVYRAYLHPLRSVPGPLICHVTSLWIWWRSYVGDECTYIDQLHAKYGPVIRVAPNEVCIADGNALGPIYSEKGGFLKAPSYANFDFAGHATIFSAVDPAHRAVRSKAVLPLFSASNIRAGNDAIEGCVDRFVARLKSEAEQSRQAKKETGQPKPVNVLNMGRSLALDAMSGYLFGRSFGGVEEKSDRLSASGYVDAVVAIGRIFFLPNSAFRAIEWAQARFSPDKEGHKSADLVGNFAASLVKDSEKGDGTYQARLRKAGISDEEIKIQCEDVIFAGTDSTGMNISMLCWYLAKHPDIYEKLKHEVSQSDSKDPNASPLSIPYLDAVLREGLRLAMANPIRLPRTVPPQGWLFTDNTGKHYEFPPGTQVGAQLLTLQTNPHVFLDPMAFKPERWLETPTPEMQRDLLAFSTGARQCIARNLAMAELSLVVRAIAREDVLAGARPNAEKVELLEWFNSKVVGERIDLVWE